MEPLKLKVKNFYTLVDGEINFTKFTSALILGYYENNTLMSNGAGKSSIFEAISWVIFNETRQTKVDDVIRWTTNEVIVDFEFIFGQNIYKISRRRSRIAKESSVSFFIKNGNSWINDSGTTNSETNKKILQLLKIDAKIFLNSVYFKQHDISLFANSSPSDRKDIIKSIMKLERWDEYQKKSKGRLKLIKDDIDKTNRIIDENKNVDIAKKDNEKLIELLNNDLAILLKQQIVVQNKLHSLFELKKECSLDNLSRALVQLSNKILELKNTGKKLKQNHSELCLTIEDNNNILAQISQNIMSFKKSISALEDELNKIKSENCSFQELEDDIMHYRIEIGKYQNIINDIDGTSSMVGIGECPVCLVEINESNLSNIRDSRQIKAKKASIELDVCLHKLDSIKSEYSKRRINKANLDNSSNELSTRKLQLTKFEEQFKYISEKNKTCENNNISIVASMRAVIDQITTLKIETEAIERRIVEQKAHNIDVEIIDVDLKNKGLSEIITNKNIELGALYKEREFLDNKIKIFDMANESLAKLNKHKTSFDQLVRYFGKEGIQAIFIESVVDELEQYANQTLSHICNEPTIIKLRTQKKTGDSWQETLEIDVIMNGRPQSFESLGGGERFRISLALRIGLSEVLVKRAGGEIKFLLLDEVDSPLDAYGLNNLFENIVKGLEKRFKIMVISHNDKLKDLFDHIIVVNKTSKGSYVIQG